MGKIFGGILKMLVLCNFLKMLVVSDKTIHNAFRTRTTRREHFHFHHLPKLYMFVCVFLHQGCDAEPPVPDPMPDCHGETCLHQRRGHQR